MICPRNPHLSLLSVSSSLTEPIRILCIDDDPGFLRLLQKGLESHGFEVTTAFPGIDAFMQQKGSAGQFYAVISRLPSQRAPPDSGGVPPSGSPMPLKSCIKAFAASPAS